MKGLVTVHHSFDISLNEILSTEIKLSHLGSDGEVMAPSRERPLSHLGMLVALVTITGLGIAFDMAQGESSTPSTTLRERAPAAVERSTGVSARSQISGGLEVFKRGIGCEQDDVAKEVPAAHVRWTGRVCWPSVGTADIEIRNERNQFSATVFQVEGKSFETDLIPLEPGVNRLRVRSLRDGTEDVFMITRTEN